MAAVLWFIWSSRFGNTLADLCSGAATSLPSKVLGKRTLHVLQRSGLEAARIPEAGMRATVATAKADPGLLASIYEPGSKLLLRG